MYFLQTLKDVEPYMNELFQELQDKQASIEVRKLFIEKTANHPYKMLKA